MLGPVRFVDMGFCDFGSVVNAIQSYWFVVSVTLLGKIRSRHFQEAKLKGILTTVQVAH